MPPMTCCNLMIILDLLPEIACTLLHHMNCYNIHEVVYCHNTNDRPAIKDETVLSGINSIQNFF